MKDYSQIIKGMTGTLWVIQEDSLQMIVDIVNRRLAGEIPSDEEIRLRIEAADNGDREHERLQVGGGVGVLPVYGPLFPKANLMTELSGATSMEQLRADLDTLVADDSVKTIVLDVDSPGGTVDMTQETGEAILAARSVKPIYAVANNMAASGAHWLSSMATKFYSTPSGKVGSIGVLGLHEDRTQANANQGRKITIINAGEYKAAGHPDKKLSEKDRDYLQGFVDEAHEVFIDAVATGRGISAEKVKSEWADGRVFSAKTAAEMGMIDEVKTLDVVLGELLMENKATPVYGTKLAAAITKTHMASNKDMQLLSSSGSLSYKSEVADKEHSEPGTQGENGEPVPRERESEPVRFYPQTDPKSDENHPEGSVQMEDSELRELLGIGPEDDLNEKIAVLMSAAADKERKDALNAKARKFTEDYPEEAAELERMKLDGRTTAAREFADSFLNLQHDGKVYAVPMPLREKIEQAHLDFTAGNLDLNGFSELIKEAAEGSLSKVELGTRGTATTEEDQDDDVLVRNLAAEAKRISKEENMDYGDAMTQAMAEHPDWAQAYDRIRPSAKRR